jgi:acyl-CoA synthetase (NDP forming)
MAKRRELKQDIKQLVDEVVVDCLQYMKANPDKEEGKIKEIISEILKLRKDLIYRVNNVSENSDAKKVKEHFDSIVKDLIEKTDEAFKKISALPRK